MRLHLLKNEELTERLSKGELRLRVGPYIYQIQSNILSIEQGLNTLYRDFNLAEPEDFPDFDVALRQLGLTQRLRKRSEFLFDQHSPFDSIPAEQSYAFLEWGMNWCVSILCNEYLKLHAAVVAKNGAGVVMPGIPGAGKSTLSAALGLSGWRVLSDEHALIPPVTANLIPLPRPVSLKNESIDVIRAFSTDAVMGPLSENTHKGVVVHMKADLCADSHDPEPIPARMMIFPQYKPNEPQRLLPRARTASFILAAYHSFNYSLMGESGFASMKYLLDRVECFDLVYHDLDWAVGTMDKLLA